MAEIDPVILRLEAQDKEYKSSLSEVVRLNEKMGKSIIEAANKIDSAADKIVQAFSQMASSDKAASIAISQAEAAKIAAVEKAKAAIEAATKAQENSEKQAASVVAEASKKIELAKEQVARAATDAAREEARAVQVAAVAEQRAAKEKQEAARKSEQAAKSAAKAAEKAARDEVRASREAAKASEKAAKDKIRAQKAAEDQVKKSSASMSSSLKGLAASFAAGFGVSQLVGLADSFTRIQNALKVTGLEGQMLSKVQGQLLDQSTKYGVSLEEIAKLYGGVSQAAGDLGITSAQTVQITEATAQALKITGTSAVQAQGAILGLVQALSAGKVTTEEFNQMNEGGLRPLLQLAANTDKYQGSLAKLKKDLGDGVLSSKQLAQAVLEGANALEGKASKAALTLSGAMEGLNSQLVVYFGEADKANGVSVALATAIKAIADNLDVLVPAVAVLTGAIGVRYVAGAIAATTATGALGLAMASLQTAGIAAVIVGIGILINEVSKATDASEEYQKATEATNKIQGEAAEITDTLSKATGRAREEAIKAAKAKRDQAKADLQAAQAALIHAEAQAVLAKENLNNKPWWQSFGEGAAIGESGGRLRDTQGESIARADSDVKAAQSNIIKLNNSIAKLTESINAPAPSNSPDTEAKKKGKVAKAKAGPTMATAAEQQAELDRIAMEELQARLQLAETAQERVDLQRDILAKEYAMRLKEIDSNEKFTNAQKQAQKDALKVLYGNARMGEGGESIVTPSLYGNEVTKEYEDAMREVGLEILKNQQKVLEDMASQEPNRVKRKELEEKALAIQQEIERALLKESLERGELANATASQKEQAVKNLETSQGIERNKTSQRNESPLQQRKRELNEASQNMGDAVEQIGVDAMDRFGDSIANAASQYIKLGGIAGDVINGIIQDLIKLAAKQAIMGLFGGDGKAGALAGIGKSLGFRAAGGSVVGGAGYIVGENGPEFFRPTGSGSIISNRALSQGISGRGNSSQPIIVKVEAGEYFDARVDNRASGVAAPIASRSASEYSGASYAMSQRSAPGTMQKYNQLKG